MSNLNSELWTFEFNLLIQDLCFRHVAMLAIAAALPACGRVRIG
jgi:hypothetical protein